MSQSITSRSVWHVDIYYIALDIPIFSCRRRVIFMVEYLRTMAHTNKILRIKLLFAYRLRALIQWLSEPLIIYGVAMKNVSPPSRT